MSDDSEWLLGKLNEAGGGRINFTKLSVAWVKERGTKGNVLTWPRVIVWKAFCELENKGLAAFHPVGMQEMA
jgi:hypothetical protein